MVARFSPMTFVLGLMVLIAFAGMVEVASGKILEVLPVGECS